LDPAIFISSIGFYLTCLVAALLIAVFNRNISVTTIKILAFIHGFLLALWFILHNENETVVEPGISNYLFLAFFCSGILIAGIIARKKFVIFLKVYFFLFLLSAIVFIISPSKLLAFISSGKLNSFSTEKIHLKENIYLVKQSTRDFRMIKEMGLFHKTLARNIQIPLERDSLKLIGNSNSEIFLIRVYGSSFDSTDIHINSSSQQDSGKTITRKISK
jgi:hypothetical protein